MPLGWSRSSRPPGRAAAAEVPDEPAASNEDSAALQVAPAHARCDIRTPVVPEWRRHASRPTSTRTCTAVRLGGSSLPGGASGTAGCTWPR